MNEHLKMSEIELNELLAEYWKLRHETGEEFIYHVYFTVVEKASNCRCIHGDTSK